MSTKKTLKHFDATPDCPGASVAGDCIEEDKIYLTFEGADFEVYSEREFDTRITIHIPRVLAEKLGVVAKRKESGDE